MRTMKFLMCVACLCSAAVFARTAMTQEKPVDPQNATIPEPVDKRFFDDPPLTRKPITPTRSDLINEEPPLDPINDPRGANLVPNSSIPDGTAPREYPRESQPNTFLPPDGRVIVEEFPGFAPAMRPRRVTRTVIQTLMEPIPQEEREASIKLQAAVQSLKTGKDEAARKAAADVIQQQLTTQFESDLKQREKELTEVEQRVKTLREQLDKRKSAQAEIINLRLQTLVNEANGLGFPGEDFRTDDLFAPQVPIAPRVERFESDLDRDGSFLTPVNPESNLTRPADPFNRQ